MTVPRVYAPTPFFLKQKGKVSSQPAKMNLPFIYSCGIGTPLFPKGRGCLSFVLSLLKTIMPQKNEVIIPAYGAHSLAFSILRSGLKIRLVDTTPETFFPNFKKYKEVFSKHTLAAILPYNWGIFPPLVELQEIHKFCHINNVYYIDDFATSIPNNLFAGYFNQNSLCVFFSYGKTKILTIMDGGYAYFILNHPISKKIKKNLEENVMQIKERSFALRDIKKSILNFAYHFYCSRAGFFLLSKLGLTAVERLPQDMNIDMNPLSPGWCNALGEIINKFYNKSNEARRKIFKNYHKYLADAKDGKIFLFNSTKEHIGSRFPLLMKNQQLRDNVYSLLNKYNIGASLGYKYWLKNFDILKPFLKHVDDTEFQGAQSLQNRLLTLPAHGNMNEKDVINICNLIKKV